MDFEKGLGINDRIFKFDDPVLISKIHEEKNMLFTSCWDKQIRAILLDSGEVDKTWIKCAVHNQIAQSYENHSAHLERGCIESCSLTKQVARVPRLKQKDRGVSNEGRGRHE